MARKLFNVAAVLGLALAPAFGRGYLGALDRNKKVVFDFYRLVFAPRNADLAEINVAEDMIEHNPRMPNGRVESVQLIQSLPKAVSDEVAAALKNPRVLITAEGDLVTYIRVKGGKIVEDGDGGSR